MTHNEIRRVLAEHRQWLVTAGREGKRAILRDAILRGAILRGADLRGADLSGAILRGAILSGADLTGRTPTTTRAEVSGGTIMNEADALLAIQELMNEDEWTPTTLDEIANILERAGYPVRDISHEDNETASRSGG